MTMLPLTREHRPRHSRSMFWPGRELRSRLADQVSLNAQRGAEIGRHDLDRVIREVMAELGNRPAAARSARSRIHERVNTYRLETR